jgi:hypothetical protein
VPHHGTKNRLTNLIKNGIHNTKYIRVPLTHPLLPLPQEEVVALPHLLRPVVVEHLQDPPALEADVHSSSQSPQLLTVLGPAMVSVTLYTAPRIPHPGCGSTCPQARPAALPQNGGVSPLALLRLPSVEHVMAPHQGHQSGASAPVSQPLLVTQHPRLADASHHAEVSPLATLVVYTAPPRAREVPNLYMHQKTNKQ